MAVKLQTLRKRRFFYGWWMVATGFTADFVNIGAGVAAMGVLLVPMQQALGTSRTALSFALTIRTAVSGVASPIVGPWIDRVGGARVVMAVGSFLGGLGLVLAGIANSPWQFLLTYGALGGLGMVTSGFMVTSALISKWFIRFRGRAIAIAALGLSFGGLAIVPLTQFLLDSLTWRHAWVVLGLLTWAVILPLALFMVKTSPESMGLRPDGDPPEDADDSDDVRRAPDPTLRRAVEEVQWTRREALHSPTFWILIGAFALGSAEVSGLNLHARSYMAETMTSQMATWAYTTFFLGAIIAKPLWGYLVDSIPVRYVMVAGYLISSLSLVLFIRMDGNLGGFMASITYGAGSSTMSVLQGAMWATYFGRNLVGSIRGIVVPFQLVSNAIGPVLAGWIFDTTGSYRIAFYIFLGQALAASALAFMAKPPRKMPAHVPAGT